ncbi:MULTISPECIES: DUF3916 domain-containing protein [Streptococcus]|nr:DUF3916 domain-containing protein [Streptococcus suis]MBM7312001.1 DUF3916 domain-containing protein [Streptococcus suis]MBM7318598.1 DUF3916 domain-containing protein [Streptococcus suis]MBY4964214.1 DUF3916 domain-containing protein [Streptococcus suis]MCO8241626.1 DUF3916 domain-containing protein [Streptococcus suis]TII10064.1 DUF3916 domain-containing protein [Streptococcus suis]
MKRLKKERGQHRKLQNLLKAMSYISWSMCSEDALYDHFHVPSSPFIQSTKTRPAIKRQFCQGWEILTERFIAGKPEELRFCKVVSILCLPELWSSQLIVFYDQDYYERFFKNPRWHRNLDQSILINTRNRWLTSVDKCIVADELQADDGTFLQGEAIFLGEFPSWIGEKYIE